MVNRRLLRVAEQLREEISEIVRRAVHDPRVSDRDFTILRVVVSPDLRHAKVHVSTLLEGARRDELVGGLQSAAGFVRRELRARLRLKAIPELTFLYDGGLVQSQKITDMINALKREAGA